MADISVVALFCDNRVRQKKSQLHPIYNQEIRQELVDAVKYVDYCLIAPEFNGMERPTEQVLRNLRPDIFATSDSTWQEHIEIFNELNIKLVIIPRLRDDISTTQTIEKIQSLKTE
jgi:bifunctional ADP-heptose synthase (sugar kinase/adenylyltransferase)